MLPRVELWNGIRNWWEKVAGRDLCCGHLGSWDRADEKAHHHDTEGEEHPEDGHNFPEAPRRPAWSGEKKAARAS